MTSVWSRYQDDLGPSRIVVLHEPAFGLRAYVVVDNVAAGPAIGGTRMAADVTLGEVCRLARAMTLKNAAAGIPHGGAKSGIVASPDLPGRKKERLVRAFARAIAHMTDYIPGPDMGTDETAMAWVHDEIGRAAGLPRVLGGIPLDDLGATGFGLTVACMVAQEHAGVRVEGGRVAIQGFGAVGRHAARFLAERGAAVVAVSDSQGGIANPDGLDVPALVAHKLAGRPVREFGGGRIASHDAVLTADCDILVPAARPDALTLNNVADVRARLVVPGANIPATLEAEAWMHEHGLLMIPDYIANAGGVICAAVEVAGGSQAQALALIEERIAANTREVLRRTVDERLTPREAADRMARARVEEAMALRMKGHRPVPGWGHPPDDR